jgi:hypothetical protein
MCRLLLTLLVVTTATSVGEAVTGDLNEDGVVDFSDFFIFSDNFGKEGSPTIAIADTVVHVLHDTTVVTVRDTITITRVDTFRMHTEPAMILSRLAIPFDSPEAILDWPQSDNWEVQNGFVGVAGSETLSQLHYPQDFTEDVDVSVDAHWVSGSEIGKYGLALHFSTEGGLCIAITAHGGFTVLRWSSVEGRWVNLIDWTPSDRISQRGVNRLRVITSDGDFSFFINGHLVSQFRVDDLTQGRVGLFVSANQAVLFDDLVIGSAENIVPAVRLDTLYVARVDSAGLVYRMLFAYLAGREDASRDAYNSVATANWAINRDFQVILNFVQPEVEGLLSAAGNLSPPAEMQAFHEAWLEILRNRDVFFTRAWYQMSGSTVAPQRQALLDAALQLVIESANRPKTCFCSRVFVPPGCEEACASLLGD